MTFAFVVAVSVLILIDYKRNKQWLSPLTVFSVPYLIVILINNTYAVNKGFYKITNPVLFVIFLGLMMFFIGNSIVAPENDRMSEDEKLDTEQKLMFYKIQFMIICTLFIEVIITMRLLWCISRVGFNAFVYYKGILCSGITGHLMLILNVLLPYMLLTGLKEKRKLCIFIYFLGVLLFFLTFVKYHVICLIVISYLFIASEEEAYVKKGAVLIAVFCMGLFVANYLFSFVTAGVASSVSNNFYINHLWKYLAGSIIRNNDKFSGGYWLETGFFYKIGSITFALPNMFLAKLGIKPLFLPQVPGMIEVATNGEESNANDLIGYLFTSKGKIIEIILFCAFMFIFGFICKKIYNSYRKNRNLLEIYPWIFFTFFLFFAFFGLYGTLSNTWETLVYGVFIPGFFRKKVSYQILMEEEG